MRVFKYSQNKITNFVGDANMQTENAWITGQGSATFDMTYSRFIAIINTDAEYFDVVVTGTDFNNEAFSFNERVYTNASNLDLMITNDLAQFKTHIIDLDKYLLTASVSITPNVSTKTTGLLLAGQFTEFADAFMKGFSGKSLNTFLKGRSAMTKAYKLSSFINTYQALEGIFTSNVGEYFLCTIPSDKYGGFFSEYGRVDFKGAYTMRNHKDINFDMEVTR